MRFALTCAFFVACVACAACGTPVGGGDVVIVVNDGNCSGEQECVFDFGQVGVTTSSTNTFTIKNVGENGTDVSSFSITGDPTFTVEGQAGQLSTGATTTATVTFSPTSVSSSTGQFVVKWDGGASTTSISLTGKGK